MCAQNAEQNLSIRLAEMGDAAAFSSLCRGVSLALPQRIECDDISHTRAATPSSAWCLIKTARSKRIIGATSDIKNVAAGDDYAAIAQVMERRFAN